MYLYRAIDSVGDTVEFWFSKQRDLPSAKRAGRRRFFVFLSHVIASAFQSGTCCATANSFASSSADLPAVSISRKGLPGRAVANLLDGQRVLIASDKRGLMQLQLGDAEAVDVLADEGRRLAGGVGRLDDHHRYALDLSYQIT
jgi:hypothetical protein